MTRRKPAFRPKTCETCGTEFDPRSGRQKWCSPGGCQAEPEAAGGLVEPEPPEPGARPGLDRELLAAVKAAVERNAQELEWYGDPSDGGYRSVGFAFVRDLRAHPMLEDLDPPSFLDTAEPILEALLDAGAIYCQPVEVLPETPWTLALGELDCYGNAQDPCEDVLKLWGSLRPVPGLAGAVRDARRAEGRGQPDYFGGEWASPRYEPRRVFLRVCQALSVWSREAGTADGSFPLALEPLAREMGWPRRTVGDWRTWAEAYGYLVRTGAYAKGKAATYRLGPGLGGSEP